MALSRPVRWIFRTFLLLLVLLAGALAWVWWQLNGSLAPLDGELQLTGLNDRVTVERDAQGIPTIHSSNQPDRAFALGVLHAQERFFQMDLLRRNSAGELSALFGPTAAAYDSRIRTHQFRQRAERAAAALDENDRRLLASYTRGVNQGLAQLSSPPFEYRLLNVDPRPWREADSMLTLYAMYLDLQPEWNEQERSLAIMRDLLPADWYRFLTPEGGQWDAPVEGEAYRWEARFPDTPLAELQSSARTTTAGWRYRDSIQPGSNNWSVSGDRTGYDAAMVANDMHLGLRVPNIWYRASWYRPGDGRRITGATLPGAPVMVVGSNERIAWGFTNSNADFHDSILLQTNAEGTEYRTEDGWEPFRVERETVEVKGGEPIAIDVRLTRWGPVIGEDHFGNLMAMRWVAHDVEGANLDLLRLERANTVYDALDIAATTGIPGQNLNVVDDRGNLAWTIMGRLPDRFGFEEAGITPDHPSDWSSGSHGWRGYLSAREYPTIVNPEHGRLWSANARIVSGDKLDQVGWGSYALGARQQQIRDGLFGQERFSERDFLDLQLDDRAVFLERWQRLMLAVLNDTATDTYPELANLRDYVRQWQGRASKTSVGYRAVKRFREQVIDQTVGQVYRYLENASNTFWPGRVDNLIEYPVWALVNQQPARHLPAGYPDWTDFMTRMALATREDMMADGEPLAEQTWGEINTLAIRHPLSDNLPFLSRWLDMPAEPMDGDAYMPRVQTPDSGASERLAVAPGQEENGIFHMATGQSGHPLSPYFDRGHRDWVEGRPSAFLPGPTEWTLELVPAH